MKRIVMCIALLASTISWGQVVTNELVFYLDANVDTDGTDGWDFTQPAVPGGGGTLGVVVANAIPTNMMENEGGRYFHTTGVNECFAGAVPTTGVRSFTYEIWLRVNGLQFIDEDNAVAAFLSMPFEGSVFVEGVVVSNIPSSTTPGLEGPSSPNTSNSHVHTSINHYMTHKSFYKAYSYNPPSQ